MATDWDPTWKPQRLSAGTKILVRLERIGGLADSPEEEQIRQKVGASTAVSAGVGDCKSLLSDPTNVFCGEYHVPAILNRMSVLGDVLPDIVTVRSGGVFGFDVFNQPQEWEITGVKVTGFATRNQTERKRRQQETTPTDPDPGKIPNPFTPGLTLALVLLALVGFAFTPAGQEVVERVVPGE